MAEGPDLSNVGDLGEVLTPVVRLIRTQLDFADGVTVTMQRDERFETANASSDDVWQLDQVQYRLGGGPCVAATETGTAVLCLLAAEEARWSEFVRAARADGFQSVLSAPLSPVRGAVNIYSRRADSFSAGDIERATLFAEHVAVVVAHAGSAAELASQNEHLHIALQTRERVGEAKGILMERQGLTADEAFDRLRRASQNSNRPLRDIAEEVIESARDTRSSNGG
jgi:hypothetical protein